MLHLLVDNKIIFTLNASPEFLIILLNDDRYYFHILISDCDH